MYSSRFSLFMTCLRSSFFFLSFKLLTAHCLLGSRWKVKNLSYKISKYPPKLKRKDVDAEVQRAFNVWSGYTDLSFTPKSGQVHIEIRFETGEHGDGDPFDGPGGTLAHAYFPVSFPQFSHFLPLVPHSALSCLIESLCSSF